MKTRFDLDFEFCTSFYEQYNGLIKQDGVGFIVTGTYISMTYANKLRDQHHEVLYKIVVEFSKDRLDIYSCHRDIYHKSKKAYQNNLKLKQDDDNRLVTFRHSSLYSASVASSLIDPDEKFLLRLVTQLTIGSLGQYAIYFNKLTMPSTHQYKGELTDEQSEVIEFLKESTVNTIGLLANSKFQPAPRNEYNKTKTSLPSKKMCLVS